MTPRDNQRSALEPDAVTLLHEAPHVLCVQRALAEALGPAPGRCEANDGDLDLSFRLLGAGRVIALGSRTADAFQQPPGGWPDAGAPDAGGPLRWRIGIARYYDVAAIRAAPDHVAAAVVEDFAPSVFVRECRHHLERMGRA